MESQHYVFGGAAGDEATLDYLQSQLFVAAITPMQGGPVAGAMVARAFGAVHVSRLSHRLARIDRTRRHIGIMAADRLALTIAEGPGRRSYAQAGREAVLADGDGAFTLTAQPFTTEAEQSHAALNSLGVWIDMPEARRLMPHLGSVAARKIPAASPALSLLRDYSSILLDAKLSGGLEAIVEAHLADLLRGVLDDPALAHSGETSGVRAARRAAALKLIAKNYMRPDFTLDRLAVLLKVSPRIVQAALTEGGTTFKEELVRLRLQRARSLLAAGGRVSDIAYACGFNDLSNFNKAFRAHFGGNPSSFR
ncbi:hypothetical protein sos41_26490 [Alphaproteobacteria bacterium SO-S41]|nr:hypothetical protein sos41_26490 [Alphaproteobacteria bacterium SO-S41]